MIIKELFYSPTLRNPKALYTLLKNILNNLVNEIIYFPFGTRKTSLWEEDKTFCRIYSEIKNVSMSSPIRLYSLYQLAKSCLNIEGDVAELGVYKGGSAKLLSKVFKTSNSSKKLHLLDTFEGFIETSKVNDLHRKGDFKNTSVDKVKSYLSDCENFIIYKGLFSETLPKINSTLFSFVHIDADLYSSIKECCDFFYPRMSKGGIIVFDDYGFVSCPGAKKAVDEFFKNKQHQPIYLLTGQCIVIIN